MREYGAGRGMYQLGANVPGTGPVLALTMRNGRIFATRSDGTRPVEYVFIEGTRQWTPTDAETAKG